MRSLSLLVLLGSFLVFQTTRKEGDPLITHRKVSEGGRSLASGEGHKCMRDLFSIEALKKEVADLEASLDTNRISGKWRHLELSALPTPAAVFLKTFGDKLGDSSSPASFEHCGDVPCLYNSIYETPEGIAGYVHYLWYLRTGVYLAADNLVPDQQSPIPGRFNGKSFPLNSYLFDEDELFGFWRLGKMLKAPHATLTYLKEIQRIPRGERMEGARSAACGLAHSDGWITLSDGCLTVYRRSDSGYFYSSIIHELTHQLDFEEGLRYNNEFYRSQREDFLSLSGFQLLEYRDTSGAMVRQWDLRPGFRTVSAYARGSPEENFAELLAYYRTDGDSTREKVEEASYEFAGTYYHGKKFESRFLADAWAEEFSSKRTKDVLKTVVTCPDPECITREISLLGAAELGRIRSEETDGCRVLSDPIIGQSLPAKIETKLAAIADEIQTQAPPELRERLSADFDQLLGPEAAYGSFFACHALGLECYVQEVSKKKAEDLAPYGELSEKILSVYLWTFPFEKVQREITTFYQSLLASREGSMKTKADELWESCKKIPQSDSLPPLGSEYVVREGYMVSSFYNCLNRGFNTTLSGSLDAIKLQEFSPENPQERQFIMSHLRPRMTGIFDDKLRSARALELRYRDAFVEQRGSWLHSAMRSNRWWMPRGRVDQAGIEAACRESSLQLIGGDIFFHLKKDLYKDLVTKVCTGIR